MSPKGVETLDRFTAPLRVGVDVDGLVEAEGAWIGAARRRQDELLGVAGDLVAAAADLGLLHGVEGQRRRPPASLFELLGQVLDRRLPADTARPKRKPDRGAAVVVVDI